MNRKGIILTMLVLLILTVAGCSNSGDTKKIDLTDTIVDVNGESITEGDLQNYLDVYKSGIVTTMVQDKLLEQALKEKGIEVTDENIEDEFNRYKDSMEGEDFKEYLIGNGINEEGFKMNIKQMLVRNSLIEKVKSEIEVSEEDIRKVYDESQGSLIAGDFTEIIINDEEIFRKAQEILDNGGTKKDIEEQLGGNILSISEIMDLGIEQGDLGLTLRNIEEGEVVYSNPVDGVYNIHILNNKKESYDDLKEYIESKYREDQKYIEFEKFINSVRDNAVIEYKEIETVEEVDESVENEKESNESVDNEKEDKE